mgnify:CR=1 FL=1
MSLNPQTEQHRIASEILSGQKAYSEILAYKLVKIDTSTSQVIQEFYFMNTNSEDVLNFEDHISRFRMCPHGSPHFSA